MFVRNLARSAAMLLSGGSHRRAFRACCLLSVSPTRMPCSAGLTCASSATSAARSTPSSAPVRVESWPGYSRPLIRVADFSSGARTAATAAIECGRRVWHDRRQHGRCPRPAALTQQTCPEKRGGGIRLRSRGSSKGGAMPSAWIDRRTSNGGETRFRVRYRLGGRETPPRYGGIFTTQRGGDRRAVPGSSASWPRCACRTSTCSTSSRRRLRRLPTLRSAGRNSVNLGEHEAAAPQCRARDAAAARETPRRRDTPTIGSDWDRTFTMKLDPPLGTGESYELRPEVLARGRECDGLIERRWSRRR